MKIALIFPRYRYPTGDPPLGVAYLASYLRSFSDCQVDIIDTTFNPSADYIKEYLCNNNYDLIGISVMTSVVLDAYKIAKLAKDINPSAKVIFGGPHATLCPEEILSLEYVDGVIIGEGEETFLEIARHNGLMCGIEGCWFKEGGKIIKNRLRDPKIDLDDIPFPAWDLLPMEEYFRSWYTMDNISLNLKGTSIITSRGCPYSCSFCQPALNNIFGNNIRQRSAMNVAQEIISLREKFGLTAFHFHDDIFGINKQWVRDFCDILDNKGIKMLWSCNTRADLIDYESFDRMKKSGLSQIFVGIESGSQRVLDEVYNKDLNLENIRNGINIAKQLKLNVRASCMIGAPTETKKEISQTISFIRRLPIDEVIYCIATPFPGTRLYEQTKENIKKNLYEFDYYKNPVYAASTIFLEKSYLIWIKRIAVIKFYIVGKRLLIILRLFFNRTGRRRLFLKMRRF